MSDLINKETSIRGFSGWVWLKGPDTSFPIDTRPHANDLRLSVMTFVFLNYSDFKFIIVELCCYHSAGIYTLSCS